MIKILSEMKQAFQSLHEKVRIITKPNQESYPDPLVRQFLWSRNIACFETWLIYVVIICIFVGICDFTLPLKLTFLSLSVSLLFSFPLLCRSYRWIWNLKYTLICLIFAYKSFDHIAEAPYSFSGFLFVNTTNLLMKTGDARLTLGAAVAYIWICLTKFRESLMIAIQEEEPEVFVNQYLRFIIFYFLLMLCAVFGLVITLDKRSIELLRVKNALENALEQQKTFLFSFSHELRNPINSLLENLQLVLQGEALSTRAAEMLNVAKVCGEILLHNINNVLDIGKHEIGRLEMNPAPTQLSELLQRTWSIYSELLRQKKLKSQLKLDKDLPAMVRIDPHKLNQVLLNLLGNSVKFTERGVVTVTAKWLRYSEINEKCFEPVPYDDIDEGLFEKEENLSTISLSRYEPGLQELNSEGRQVSQSQIAGVLQSRQESRGILKIIVKDTGTGMKKDALEKLFKKFSQVSENVSHRQIGTGLGLFITKEICNAMHGEIRAYSKFGIGSTFIVCIPLSPVPSGNLQRAGSVAVINQLVQKRIKALVADDSPFNVNLICNYFSQFGASVVSVAYNGYDIFTKYKEYMSSGTGIDVVTLDIDMPGMDGRQVCDSIRKYEKENRLRPVVVILISGNSDREQVEEYVNPQRGHKADCFLRKPVSFSDFSRAVYNLVEIQ